MLPEQVLREAWSKAEQCNLFLVVGTSVLVQPAATLPMVAKEVGATLIEINLEQTPLSTYADVSILGQAGEVLPQLVIEEHL